MKVKLFLAGLSSIFLFSRCSAQSHDEMYHTMLDKLYKNSVPSIKVEKMKQLPKDSIYILDTRQKKEYEVSHIKNARWVGFESFNKKKINDIPKDAKIIVYCSIGYRSERIGEKMEKWGFSDVQNIYGGIFEWVNQNEPVYNSEGETNKIHAYNKTWGQWLREGEKIYK